MIKKRFLFAFVAALLVCTAVLIPRWWQLTRKAPPTIVAAEQVAQARELAQRLLIVEPDQTRGYDRAFFGAGWLDLDGNGCDTRLDVLASWIGTECTAVAGDFIDPYTGYLQRFLPGPETGAEVHIDHVVALKDAWIKGAWAWDQATAYRFANDQANLLPTAAGVNQAKSDGDASQWLPPDRGYHCAYVVAQIQIKTAYSLGVSGPEKQALLSVLAGC